MEVIVPEKVAGRHGGGDAGLIHDFVESITSHKQPLADGMSGVLSTAVTSAAVESMKTGMPVEMFNNDAHHDKLKQDIKTSLF